MAVKDCYGSVIRQFEFYFPEYAYHVVHWYPVGYDEIMMILDDGRMLIYDGLYQKIKFTEVDDTENPYLEEDEWRRKFGEKLYRRMILGGYRNALQLSEATGISNVTLSKYLTGKATPSSYNLGKICRVLKCSVSEFYDFNQERRQ